MSGKGAKLNKPCPCGKLKADGTPKKYKHCCLLEEEKVEKRDREVAYFKANFRRLMITGPYKQCPNPSCSNSNSFGVFTPMGDKTSYSRQCTECGFQKSYPFPEIKKTVLYLDQFVISNLIKLLDKEHPSHERIKADPFWKALFIKLEEATRLQAIVCPDSFYHREESLAGSTDFKLMKRLYEHFSSGKTLYPSTQIDQIQIAEHFKNWLDGKKTTFDLKPQSITSEDLNSWSVGLRVSVNMNPLPGEVDKLHSINASTKEQLKVLWARWKTQTSFGFIKRIKEETLGLGKGLIEAVQKFHKKRHDTMARLASGQNEDFDLDDLFPPPASGLLEMLFRIARTHGIPEDQIQITIVRYFSDTDALLEIPKVRIGSVMYAGLARRAVLGKKEPPKSLVDVGFISSYLPYCDALFVDKESASLLKELPKETPQHLRLNEFHAKVFSLNEKEEFLEYLDELIKQIPPEQLAVLKDLNGDEDVTPYWDIIEHEKRDRD